MELSSLTPDKQVKFQYWPGQKHFPFHSGSDTSYRFHNSGTRKLYRPFVIGRKNWLFSGSPKGTEASVGIYTLVETAKANGLAPMKYIKYILSDMPGSAFLEHPEYLPWNPLIKEFCQ